MTASPNLLYTARVRTVGGRNGTSRSSDGRLDLELSNPDGPGSGTNPEQLLAAAWSASFEGALVRAAREVEIERKIVQLIDAEVDLSTSGDGEFSLRIRLTVTFAGPNRQLALKLIGRAHQICPYSKATRGNVEVAIAIA